jgi:hypothetical protein
MLEREGALKTEPRYTHSRTLLSLAAAYLLVGCGSGKGGAAVVEDGGLSDAGLSDGGLSDGGLSDGGLSDGGSPDGGAVVTLTSDQANDAIVTDGGVDLALASAQVLVFAPGDVLVSPAGLPDGGNPDGFLRRVVSVQASGERVLLQTSPAGLLDIMQEGDAFSLGHTSAANIRLSPRAIPDDWSASFILQDHYIPVSLMMPLGSGATEAGITGNIGLQELSGSISLTTSGAVGPREGLDLPFTISLDGTYDAKAIAAVSLNLSLSGTPSKADAAQLATMLADAAKIALTANPNAYTFTAPVVDGKVRLPPIPVPFLPFPIPWKLDIKVDVGCSVAFSGGATYSRGFASTGGFNITMSRATGQPVEMSSTKTGFDLISIPNTGSFDFEGGIKIECRVVPSITILIFDAAGPRFGIGPTLTLSADYAEQCASPPASSTPTATITTSWIPQILLSASLDAQIPIFGAVSLPLKEIDILDAPPSTTVAQLGPSHIPYSECVPCGDPTTMCCRNAPNCNDLQVCTGAQVCPPAVCDATTKPADPAPTCTPDGTAVSTATYVCDQTGNWVLGQPNTTPCAAPASQCVGGVCETACQASPCLNPAATCQPDGRCKTACEVAPCASAATCQPDGTCVCNVLGDLCFGSDRPATADCYPNSSGIGLVITFDGVESSNGDAPPGSGIGQPRDLNSFDNWCPFLSGAPGVPDPDPTQSSQQKVAAFCGDHSVTLSVSTTPCQSGSPGPVWPLTISSNGLLFGSNVSVRYLDNNGVAVSRFIFSGPGSQTYTARFY